METLVITCGGTGGHFYPGLTLARTARAQGKNAVLLLSGINSKAQSEIARANGVPVHILPQMPSPYGAVKLFRFCAGFAGGLLLALIRLHRLRPYAVVGMGSFAQCPVLAAAWLLRRPVYLHDGNARIGKANRLWSRFARLLGAGFPPVNADACHAKILDCGMPVRPELVAQSASLTKSAAIETLNQLFHTALKPELTTLLVVGGSQGAAVLNTVLPQALTESGRENLQILHLAGRGKTDAARDAYKSCKVPALVLESSEKMELFLAAADLVFARSGGSTVAELALFGKPAVLVPYPHAAEGHQLDNARFYANGGAGVIVENEQFTSARVQKLFTELLDDKEALAKFSGAARKLARPRAAEDFLAALEPEKC